MRRPRSPARPTSAAWRVLVGAGLLAVLAPLLGAQAGCRRRPAAGTCTEDIDCPAGYDCRASVCAKRAPAPGASPSLPSAPEVPPPDVATQGQTSGTRPDEQRNPDPRPDAGPPPVKRKPAPAPASPPPQPPAPPSGPLPLWKQRLKNT